MHRDFPSKLKALVPGTESNVVIKIFALPINRAFGAGSEKLDKGIAPVIIINAQAQTQRLRCVRILRVLGRVSEVYMHIILNTQLTQWERVPGDESDLGSDNLN